MCGWSSGGAAPDVVLSSSGCLAVPIGGHRPPVGDRRQCWLPVIAPFYVSQWSAVVCPGCRRWVISGHSSSPSGCPLCPPEADVRVTHRHVRFGPKAEMISDLPKSHSLLNALPLVASAHPM